MAVKIALVILLVTHVPLTQEQSNTNVGPYNPTTYETYNLDNPSTCTGVPRAVRSDRIFSITSGGNSQNTATPTSCQLTLTIESAREPMVFKLTIVKSAIRDATVQFIVYDGEMSGRKLLGFNANQGPPTGAGYFFTTGQVVTFQLTRRERDFNYDIEIVAEPIKSEPIKKEPSPVIRDFPVGAVAGGVVGGIVLVIAIVAVAVVVKRMTIRPKTEENMKREALGSRGPEYINTAFRSDINTTEYEALQSDQTGSSQYDALNDPTSKLNQSTDIRISSDPRPSSGEMLYDKLQPCDTNQGHMYSSLSSPGLDEGENKSYENTVMSTKYIQE